ncbi:glycosyltransferase [Novosphingobium sp. KCTC 2891]|uniref:glycosyltransferase n=1 Tax=Novosphingobium sp. KCTC 2891 TaxID=2989730 RepID=UPI002223CEE7|nr:glycosyltransferase [Novosphingobium sp. KCTC 2891]MCW1383857.1 glycosyltransferase [Novosphingobium sp. KCTC 2891]
MRIALIATHHADYAASLAAALAEEHDVLLVLSRRNAGRQLSPESLAWLRQRMDVRIVPHHLAPLQPVIAGICAWHIARFRPDVVHVQEHPTRSMAQLAGLLKGRLPFITTVHDPLPHSGEDDRAARVFARAYRRLRAASDRIIVHGALLAADLAGTGVDPAKIAAIPHGVLHFGRHGTPVPPVAAKHNRLIFFGRMEAYKGLAELLDANDIWLRDGLPVELLIAGAGPEMARHAKRLGARNVTAITRRLGQAELESLVAGSAAAVLPYRDATQSGVIASAFGAGRPVIATDVGSLKEAVQDAGLIVPPMDVAALADAGRRLIETPGLLEQLEEAVQRRCREDLNWQNIAARTAQLYREAGAAG